MPPYNDAFLAWEPVSQLWSVWNEREANRKALTEKDARIVALALRNDELEGQNAELISDLAECRKQNPPPPPPPPPLPPPNDKVQVLWAAGVVQSLVESVVLNRDLSHIQAVVVAADVGHKIWGPPLIRRLHDGGCLVYAYIPAPVHARVGELRNYQVSVSQNSPFAAAVWQLVNLKDAWVRDPAGNVLYHPAGYDAYVTPWLVAANHAKLVKEYVWKLGLFDGILADGLTTNQIYAGSGADFDRDGVADVVKHGWGEIACRQRLGLGEWVVALNDAKIPIVGNGAWEPAMLKRYQPGTWSGWIAGAMDEDLTHPYYPDGNEQEQGPALAQRWGMHGTCADEWLGAGKAYWLGSQARLHNLPRDQEVRFTLATALLWGAKWVDNSVHPWLVNPLGRAKGDAVQLPSGAWRREFDNGSIICDPIFKTGERV